ncbi:DUF1433 domain-containing protein [Bacillus velezensis]|uniref:DUF1433 domain-containing protein n=1 Tax=Bacillus TaxID=1386 RepID=UPI00026BA1F2|nr:MULTISPECIES: DUF1433 domain-containing protein [Bacillus]AIW31373.1 hypothetical protein KO64_16470 [Bacillus subtilis]AJK66864.1 hypothetical protein KHU1_2922 [Bacillus amyloliquefaciens KHG19]AWK47657.1 DUF1433 domain-containing protein [Bacillus velezensis]EJD69449.1 hypothetical protein BB65665_01142 [Bacillus sp. 916]EYB36305.1 hypothetical protein AW26_0110390 [Bacillus amyloliquefaciens EBL11]
MKKKYIIILILIIIAVGGLFMKHRYDQKEKEFALLEEAQNHMEKFLTTNYKNADDIHFSENYYINPMDGISVKGYTNGEKEFEGLYDPGNKEILSYTVDAEPKEECKDKLSLYKIN